jgi:hypothetical protein
MRFELQQVISCSIPFGDDSNVGISLPTDPVELFELPRREPETEPRLQKRRTRKK